MVHGEMSTLIISPHFEIMHGNYVENFCGDDPQEFPINLHGNMVDMDGLPHRPTADQVCSLDTCQAP